MKDLITHGTRPGQTRADLLPRPGVHPTVATGAMRARHDQDVRGAAIGHPADS